jgi:hypothetical protein
MAVALAGIQSMACHASFETDFNESLTQCNVCASDGKDVLATLAALLL